MTSEQIKNLEKLGDNVARAPGGMGAVLEQLAGSQNANLASAAHATTGGFGAHHADAPSVVQRPVGAEQHALNTVFQASAAALFVEAALSVFDAIALIQLWDL